MASDCERHSTSLSSEAESEDVMPPWTFLAVCCDRNVKGHFPCERIEIVSERLRNLVEDWMEEENECQEAFNCARDNMDQGISQKKQSD